MNRLQLPKNDRSKIILVVDDDEDTRNAYVDFLEEFDCSFLTACDGLEGLETYQKHKANVVLIITDNDMPKMEGRQFVTKLKSAGETVPIIMISGGPEKELRQWANAVGLIAFIPKLNTPDLLFSAVQAVFAQH